MTREGAAAASASGGIRNLLRNGQVSHNSAVAGESVGQQQGAGEAGRQEPEPWGLP